MLQGKTLVIVLAALVVGFVGGLILRPVLVPPSSAEVSPVAEAATSAEARAMQYFIAHVEEARQVVAGLLHHLEHFVKGDAVAAVGVTGEGGAVDGAGGGEDVALDAGDLHQPVDRVAGQSEVVLQAHFGGVFDLADRPAQQLGGGAGRHGAGRADLSLAAHLRA